MVFNERLPRICLCLLAASSFCRSLIVLSFHVFHGFPQESTLTFFDQMITWPNHCSCLSCKHFLMIFSFSLVLSSSAEFLSWDLTFHIHQTILESFLCSLFTSSHWTGDFHRAQHYILIIVGGWCRNGGGGGVSYYFTVQFNRIYIFGFSVFELAMQDFHPHSHPSLVPGRSVS